MAKKEMVCPIVTPIRGVRHCEDAPRTLNRFCSCHLLHFQVI
jgi:hypothetical protein